MANEQLFNSPSTTASGVASDVGPQINNAYYQKKALVDAAKETYFGQLADVASMPKHFGKKIKRYHYLPLLDDANLNDQGIDAAGATIAITEFYVTYPRLVMEEPAATVAAVVAAINDDMDTSFVAAVAGAANSGASGVGFNSITLTVLTLKYLNETKADLVLAKNIGAVKQQGSGNLYGSSKDVGVITGKLPALSEVGGRVNRVGFKRVELEGTFEKFGFFDEYTQESLDFDTDAELFQHINTEMVKGANQLTEAALQVDLLNAGTTTRFAGTATLISNVSVTDIVDYNDIMHLGIDLDNNRTPKSTKVINGSRMIDTKTVMGGRIAYIGSELIPTLKNMTDLAGTIGAAFIPVQHYGDAGSIIQGEIGTIDSLRFVVVPEMQKWSGAGLVATGTTVLETAEKVDVFPILVIGDESFTTIGFQTDGKTVKFKIIHKAPGEATADKTEPFGEVGFMSIKWYYGFMALRSERIGIIYTAAKL